MNDALLDFGLWEDCFNSLRKTSKPIYAGNQDILDTTVFQAVHDGKPELCALVFSDIHTKNVLFSGHVDADHYVNGTLYDASFAADMIMNGIQEDNSVDSFQRALLPFFDDGQDLVCYLIVLSEISIS